MAADKVHIQTLTQQARADDLFLVWVTTLEKSNKSPIPFKSPPLSSIRK